MSNQHGIECPEGWGPAVEEAFDRLVSEHWDERIHLPQDRLLFVLAAAQLVQIEECSHLIERDGLMTPATRRGAMKANPCFGIQLAASREYRRVLEMLGCTAASRKRLKIKTPAAALAGLPGVGADPVSVMRARMAALRSEGERDV